ncbi:hypothetical protein F6X38_16865 [Aureimonas leprariae]|uniref:Uncharacterized protein n=1 Tax=Plantimonas leprariae TaxID=2615207 RepID=A0A7V7PMG9_9HYPH|nr:hypothetical protein F6X38_16865 [Aureimonas leprariae]
MAVPEQLQRLMIAAAQHQHGGHRNLDRRARPHLPSDTMLGVQAPDRVDGQADTPSGLFWRDGFILRHQERWAPVHSASPGFAETPIRSVR